MNRNVAEMALIYSALKRAVREVYADWEIECSEEDLAGVVLQSGHVRVMIRTALQDADGEKKEAIYAEIGKRVNLSGSMVKKIALGKR